MSKRALLFSVVAIVLLILAPVGQKTYFIYVMCSWLMFSVAAMGLNLTLGYAGQVSLAQASFVGIGAYITSLITLAGYHWVFGWLAAMGATFAIGLVLGYPALRVQGHFLAFVTLAFNILVFLFLRNEEWLTGGSFGLVGMPRPGFFGFSTMKQIHFYYFALVLFVISAAIFWWIVRSPWGRAFKALRENPVRAESLGVKTRRITLLAFGMGCAFGGGAGAIMAPLVQFIEPGSFTLVHSLKILLMVVVGGSGFFFGPMLGAAVVILLPEVLRFTEGYYLMIYAFLVIVLMVYSPTGLIGLGGKLAARFRTKPQVRKDMAKGAQL